MFLHYSCECLFFFFRKQKYLSVFFLEARFVWTLLLNIEDASDSWRDTFLNFNKYKYEMRDRENEIYRSKRVESRDER